jgi:hypothetical protein
VQNDESSIEENHEDRKPGCAESGRAHVVDQAWKDHCGPSQLCLSRRSAHYTGDPDNPVVTWDVHDNQHRDWWGTPVVPSWYTDASLVLDLDGNPQPVVTRTDTTEMAVTIGADGFSYTRKEETDLPPWKQGEFKLGAQL